VGELKARCMMQTGRLGEKMRDGWEVWVCGSQLPCAYEAQDWVRHTYSYKYEMFVPWAYNRKLGIVMRAWWQ
jgi:hypothetical protein